MATNPTIEGLIHALHDDRDGLRQFAIRRILNLGPSAIPALVEVLKDHKEYTQEAAAIALASFGRESLPHLIAAMKHDNRRIRWGAAWVLASMGPDVRKAVPAVEIPAEKSSKASNPQYGVWSDSWLTKIRQQLENARTLDYGQLAPETC
jgi:HEAT repeat protein